jgi:DNA mismatch endonuclease (patch repair protein)
MSGIAAERISARMRSVRRKNTGCELRLAAALRASGHNFIQHARVLDCWPDLIFSAERLTVFVDGDFWHGRILCEQGDKALRRSFRTNHEFWVKKIARNAKRDWLQNAVLRRHGWSVIRLWERDVLRDVSHELRKIERRLGVRRRHFTVRNPDASLSLARWRD